MEDKRNIVIAMIAAALILFGWPYIVSYFYPAPPRPVVAAGATGGMPTGAPTSATGTGAATPGSVVVGQTSAIPTASAAAGAGAISVAAARAASPRIAIETPTLRGSINLKGARIDDLVLLRYRQTVARNSPPVQLFAPGGTSQAYFAGLGWSGAGLNAPNADTVWTAPSGAALTPTTPVTLSYDNAVGQVFTITLSVDANYMFSATQTMVNRGPAPVGVRPYAFISRVGTSPDPDTWTIHSGPMGVFNGTPQWFNKDDIDEAPGAALAQSTTGGWLGFTDHFWLGAIVPDQRTPVQTSVRQGGNGIYQIDFAKPEVLIGPNSQSVVTSRIFAGAKETRLLDAYTDAGITRLDHATDWGWFIWFVKPMFYLLDWLFRHINNFGLAIMALTLVIRGAMFPIAQKQFASMAQMRVLQPKLKELQDRHKDDKPRLQQEMMQLYKAEKVNPLAGCLPIVIQIPIFYALYKSLMLTVEMRHQPFFGWIRDLSAPDPASLVTLGHYLGVAWPAILGLSVLAVLLGITMFLQFKLNPPPTDPIQQQMFAIMPWMLMFVMAPFAAGLLLYWITNNILSIAQQQWLYSRFPAMKQATAVAAKS